MTAAPALQLIAAIIGSAVAVQSLELLSIRERFASRGFWSWSLLREEFAPAPRALRSAFDFFFAAPNFNALLLLRLAASVALVVCASTSHALYGLSLEALLAAFLAFTTLAICFRWRGTYNGGSDAMTLIVLVGLGIAGASPHSEIGQRAGLAYIAFQGTLSYFIAGVVKLRAPDWRSGLALQAFLNLPGYPVSERFRALSKHTNLMRAISWLLIAWECAFPLVFAFPRFFLITGFLFHIANAMAFGLNRFLLAWTAMYPALWYWAH